HGTFGRVLAMQQVTRGVISSAFRIEVRAVAKPSGFELLPDITDARAKALRPGCIGIIVSQQMPVRKQHRATSTGVGDDRSVVSLERVDVLPRQPARAFQVARVSVQGPTTNLRAGRFNLTTVGLQHSRGCIVNSFEETFGNAAFEERHRSPGILRPVRTRLACLFWRSRLRRSFKQSQSKLE